MIWSRQSFSVGKRWLDNCYYGVVVVDEERRALNWTIVKKGRKDWRLMVDKVMHSDGSLSQPESEWPTLKAAKVAYLVAYATGQVSVC